MFYYFNIYICRSSHTFEYANWVYQLPMLLCKWDRAENIIQDAYGQNVI